VPSIASAEAVAENTAVESKVAAIKTTFFVVTFMSNLLSFKKFVN
jgi:hypothetical protein